MYRRVLFAALVLAAVGFSLPAHILGLNTTPPGETGSNADILTQIADLVVRVIALVIAWFMRRRSDKK